MDIRKIHASQIEITPPKVQDRPQEGSGSVRDSISLGKNQAQPVKIDILHMNDLHGTIDPVMDPEVSADSPVGGLANSKALIDREKAQNPDGTMVLCAGDLAEGTMVSYLSKGKVVADALKEMDFDATALGNHDFAWGQDDLKTMLQIAETPVVAANVVKTDTGEVMDGAEPFIMKKANGINVGIIGLDTPEITHFVAKSKLEGLNFLGAAETVKKWLPEVKKQGADLVVVLSHLGFEEDKKLAKEVEGIDVIVGGHSHSKLEKGHTEGDTIIVQAGAMTHRLGKLELNIDPESKRIVSHKAQLLPIVQKELTPDPAIQKILAPYRAKCEKLGAKEMGFAREDLLYAHREAGKLNQIHADSILKASGAQFGICNSRTLRAHVKAGKVTMKDLYSALPFTEENYVRMEATGKMIMNEIEDDLRDDATELAVPTGLKYEYDPSQPEGNRLQKAFLPDGTRLEPDRKYMVVVNETMSRKPAFKNVTHKKVLGGCQKVFFDYFKKGGIWSDDADDRVKVVNK